MVELKNKQNKEKDPLKIIASDINWVYCHKDNITTILQMFTTLSTIVNDLNNKIQKAEEELEEKYNYSSESSSTYIGNALFLGIESLIRVLTSN